MSQTGERKEPPARRGLTFSHSVLLSVLFYLATSITMVIVNKLVLNIFDVPLTFLWIQLALAALILKAAEIVRAAAPIQPLTAGTFVKISPLITVNVAGLALNTLCLKHLDASLYQVARALVLPFTVALSAAILKKFSSVLVLVSCALVSSGFFVGIFAENKLEISLLGVGFAVLSSLFAAVHSIIIKRSLGLVRGSVDIVYYNNLLSAVFLLPFLLFEARAVRQLFLHTASSHYLKFVLGSVVAVTLFSLS